MELSSLAKIFKALSNEQRLRLFKMIFEWSKDCCHKEEGSGCSGEGIEKSFTKACKCMNIARSTISHHFKELKNAGLIDCKRFGQAFICRVNTEIISEIKEWFE